MAEGEMVVVRFRDGKLMKGYMRGFSVHEDLISFIGQNTGGALQVPVDHLKAVFFVKNFDGFMSMLKKSVRGQKAQRAQGSGQVLGQ